MFSISGIVRDNLFIGKKIFFLVLILPRHYKNIEYSHIYLIFKVFSFLSPTKLWWLNQIPCKNMRPLNPVLDDYLAIVLVYTNKYFPRTSIASEKAGCKCDFPLQTKSACWTWSTRRKSATTWLTRKRYPRTWATPSNPEWPSWLCTTGF